MFNTYYANVANNLRNDISGTYDNIFIEQTVHPKLELEHITIKETIEVITKLSNSVFTLQAAINLSPHKNGRNMLCPLGN